MMITHFSPAKTLFAATLCLFSCLTALPASAVEVNVDGLPVPRFVSVKQGVLVRVGPGKKYDLAWTFNKSMPVEVTAEFDIWRKIRDAEGAEGWVQQNQLSGARLGVVPPNKNVDATYPLLAGASDDAAVRAYLTPGIRVGLKKCDGSWCQVDTLSENGASTYSGYVRQNELWGAFPSETF